jgi:hypothetical protein
MIADAVADYRSALAEGWEQIVEGRRPEASVEFSDASRFLAALAEGALTFVHADPARPRFVPWITPDRRWADNGRDSTYWFAPVDGDHRYRISGRRHEECYLSATLYAGRPAHPDRVVMNVNHAGLAAGPGDTFTLDLDPPADACYVIVRQYFHDPDHDRPATLAIETADGSAPAVPDAGQIAARWQLAADFVRAMTQPPQAAKISYRSDTLNQIGTPSGWRQEEGAGRGTPDQTYALGQFSLAPDEALVMDARIPRGLYSSVVVWNLFGQSIDWREHRSTFNEREMTTRPDGTVRVVLAHRDPGVPGWLDTGGRPRGSVFWRFLLAEERPDPIRSRVVRVDDVHDLG